MLPIHKQMERDFKWLLRQKGTPSITLAYETRVGGTTVKFYGNATGGVVEKHSKTIPAVIEQVDEWTIKRLPYANLKVGQTIFYIDKSIDLSTASNIKVTWANRVFPIIGVQEAVPFGSTYLCQALVSSDD